jgi:hypothetical protein
MQPDQPLQPTGRGAASSTWKLLEPRPAAEGQLVGLRERRMRLRGACLLALACVGLTIGCSSPAGKRSAEIGPTDQQPPFVIRLAVHTLVNADSFSTGPIGLGQSRAAEVDAFAVVLTQTDARQTFEDLIRGATPEGKLYGLCGLWLVDRTAYEVALPSLSGMQDVADRIVGCQHFHVPVSEVVQSSNPYLGDIVSGKLPSRLQAYAVGAR